MCGCRCGLGKRLFAEERRKTDLRGEDKGTIQGKFEIHFGVLIPETNITLDFCDDFDRIITCFVVEKGLAKDEASDELDRIFERIFNAKPPENKTKRKHVTLELWKDWCEKFKGTVKPIVAQRSRSRRASDNDSR